MHRQNLTFFYLLIFAKMSRHTSFKYMLLCAAAMAALVVLPVSCSDDKTAEPERMPVTRLDRIIAGFNDLDTARQREVVDSLRPELTALMQILEIDSVATPQDVEMWASALPVEIFSPMADTAFRTLDDVELSLGHILARAEAEGLDLPTRRYAAVVWGRSQSIVFNDSVAIIALNHYLGPKSPAYEDWPAYRRDLKRADILPYDLAEALIATQYPYAPSDGNDNVLSRMIYEGVMAEAKMRLVKDASLADALGFSDEQLNDIVSNRGMIWNKIVSEKMLYSSDEVLMDRLFKPMPFSSPISPSAPGRTVRFTGYEIVRDYLKNNKDARLTDMLQPSFYSSPSTLQSSRYNPVD